MGSSMQNPKEPFFIDRFRSLFIANSIQHHGGRWEKASPSADSFRGIPQFGILPFLIVLIQILGLEHCQPPCHVLFCYCVPVVVNSYNCAHFTPNQLPFEAPGLQVDNSRLAWGCEIAAVKRACYYVEIKPPPAKMVTSLGSFYQG